MRPNEQPFGSNLGEVAAVMVAAACLLGGRAAGPRRRKGMTVAYVALCEVVVSTICLLQIARSTFGVCRSKSERVEMAGVKIIRTSLHVNV